MNTVIGLIIVMIVSLGLNIPLGMWRVRTKKFSFSWFISIHIAVPLIYFIRVSEGLAYWTIPIFIALAVLGQLFGGRISVSKKVYEPKPIPSNKISVVE